MDKRLPDAREEAAKLTYEKLPWRASDGPILERETLEAFIRDIQYRTLMAAAEMAVSDENAWKWSGKGAEWMTDLATSLKEGK